MSGVILFIAAIFIILYVIGCAAEGLAIGNLAANKPPRHTCFNQWGGDRCQICGRKLR